MSARKKKKCVQKMARDICLRARMKQTLSEMVGILKWAARERVFLLHEHDLIERRTKAEKSTELEEKPENQNDEALVELRGDREYDVLPARRVTAMKGLAYSGSKMTGGMEKS